MTYVMTEPVNELQSDLREEFRNQAEWRRHTADKYPEDKRNNEAAERLDRIALSVTDFPPEIIDVYGSVLDGQPEVVDDWLAMMKSVGFHYFPNTAEEFLRAFISSQTGGGWPGERDSSGLTKPGKEGIGV